MIVINNTDSIEPVRSFISGKWYRYVVGDMTQAYVYRDVMHFAVFRVNAPGPKVYGVEAEDTFTANSSGKFYEVNEPTVEFTA